MTESPEEQDRQDMAQLAAGRDAALNELMGRHAPRLYHYLLRVLQNETEAADLAEEAFVRVYQNRAKFRPGSKFSTWLYTIATNLARDLQRHRARHPHVSLEASHEETGHEFGELLPEGKPNPGELLESRERAEAVRQAVAALPEDLRVPLVLAEYEDKSHAEIAAILDCSAKAVEMRVYRARQQLRARLEKALTGWK
ncbi:MAG TPA: sigma-70 family RNA polymerase sigma factor [Bacillota bacterium]|nr:sigma-70 family RNA polymerase sigma factor [Bacillota bacterium]